MFVPFDQTLHLVLQRRSLVSRPLLHVLQLLGQRGYHGEGAVVGVNEVMSILSDLQGRHDDEELDTGLEW